jgi:ADP-L-glycero-D-manno-heptose 6-epimerase
MTKPSYQPILVTGAAGLIGSRFVESCNKKGIAVISVDQPEFFHSRKELKSVDFGEIVSIDRLSHWLKERTENLGTAPVSAIMHMGACSDTTEMNVEFLTKNNVEFSQMLWRYCNELKIPFVYASSAATYGEGELGYEDQESLLAQLRPLNPYGESKKTFDVWAIQEEKNGKSPPQWSGFKFFNVYGYGEAHKGKMASVVWHAFQQIKDKGIVRLFKSHKAGIADGEQKRDFIYVGDVVKVLHFALDHPIERGIYNLGTGKARTFLDLARATFKAMRREDLIEFIPTPVELRERYQYFTEATMHKLRDAGYTAPFTELEDGVKEYIERLSRRL